jgi:hypothetical protein
MYLEKRGFVMRVDDVEDKRPLYRVIRWQSSQDMRVRNALDDAAAISVRPDLQVPSLLHALFGDGHRHGVVARHLSVAAQVEVDSNV